MRSYSAWIGFDPREASAYAVARYTLARHAPRYLPIEGLILDHLREAGLYWRPTEKRLGKLWDKISEAPMSTEFAISRFLVPHLAKQGFALFADCDVLFRGNIMEVLHKLDGSKALYCVKHNHKPSVDIKMDGQEQTRYARKNWSSFMIFNCDHPSNKKLTLELINTVPGRDLHRFCWLEDDEIGEIGPEWNYLVGYSDQKIDPKVVHFTEGGPWFAGLENIEYADEWRQALGRWAA